MMSSHIDPARLRGLVRASGGLVAPVTLDKSVFAALVTGTLIAVGAISVKHVEHRHSVRGGPVCLDRLRAKLR